LRFFAVETPIPAASRESRANNTAPNKSSEPERNDWPTSNSGNYPIWGYSPGQSCRTVEGKPGKLCPHPSNSSILICMPDSADSMDARLSPSDKAYYDMVDQAKDAWKVGTIHDQHPCRCHDHRDQEITVGFVPPPQLPWMTSGQSEGQQCTINGQDGRLVRVDGELVCRPVQDLDRASIDARDHEAIREAAWRQSVVDAENEWRRYR
jgi:hypothetical protein